jgi:hypothetical protein
VNGRAILVAISAAGLIGALFVWARGPLRSFFGDVVVVVFLVAVLAAVRAGGPWGRVLGVGLFAVGVELWQGLGLVAPGAHWLLDLTVGSTSDPLDVLAYALGALAALALERWVMADPRARTPPPPSPTTRAPPS